MNVRVSPAWRELLAAEFDKPDFAALAEFVREEYRSGRVYPAAKNVFRAFDKCSLDNLRVVIIGQDPYHGEGQANGLCFSVNEGMPHPPSLRNIFKEIESDIGTPAPASGNLDRWAEQGVLLLNSVMTVRASEPASHAGKGWESFTDGVVEAIASSRSEIVYILWGNYAQRKASMVDSSRNLVLRSAHPSPFSANSGFFGSRPFSKTNEYLKQRGKEPIVW
jgi:uracil-DNA glycosylase